MNLFIFPGQGAQYSGIGSDLHQQFQSVKDIYAEANDILGFDITQLSFSGDEAEITLTKNTQPILVTHHYACLTAFQELSDGKITADITAGHSLGEYTALVAAGKLSFADALKLVRKRGELMGKHGEGEMMALTVGVDIAQPIAENYYCAVAGCNLADQTVVGGSSDDLSKLEQAFTAEYPRKKAIRLKTEGAFHTYYMVTAAKEFRADLDNTTFTNSDTTVLSNTTGLAHEDDPTSIRSKLFTQLFSPVLWHKNLMTAYELGVTNVYEFGGGIGNGETPAEKRANLEGMVKKAYRSQERSIQHQAVINSDTLQAATSDS
jgi:[acyl-carrier-protein] S-malonyltransferase